MIRISAPCEHADFPCPSCEAHRQAERAEIIAKELTCLRAYWSDEARYPWLRLSGTRLHTRGCSFIASAMEKFHAEQDPCDLPRFVTAEEAAIPRRPAWTACKVCRPDVEPPERPLLPKRPKARRDELASWLSQQQMPTTEDGWLAIADEIMCMLWPTRTSHCDTPSPRLDSE